ncbi:cupin domain-containing protein [Notoacmeibacter sp. MSK16QG-6]|uniref:cupin domain-containing protein n=1 Tax=Notoacmeibacter sp. MSK16QG-6 TaxID=2957982 RepID=UPI0020A12D99|nr:cupin domain-containing protein [Notoacmeibacter sp. MSK16QG-6]MCP1198739.1 cupin domain-containing protein [Notoacmeibacter sp. MSK16QG-6]
MVKAVNLNEKLAQFSEHWSPKIVAEYNGNDVMVVKFKGEFPFHSHAETDDFFLVLEGKMTMEYRDRTISVGPGELFIVPKGIEHRPVAEEEVKVLLIEPKGEPNSGDSTERAPAVKEWI